MLMDQLGVGEHRIHRTIKRIIDELKRIVVGFTATSGADGGGVIRGKRMM